MKIIHLIPFYPPHIGGMEKITKNYCDYQSNLGHEVIVLTSKIDTNNESTKKYITECNPKIHYLKTITGKGTFPIFFPSLFFNLLKYVDKNTIVHIHCATAFDGDFVPIISKLLGFKTIMHIHLDPTHHVPIKSLLINIYKQITWRTSFLFTDRIVCPTNAYFEIISKYGINRKKCVAIHNGIKLENSNYKDTTKFPNELLYVGRLAKEKNISRLLDAFKVVQKKYKSINLHIVGDGEKMQDVITKIKNENIKNVIIHGSILHGKITDVYNKCDIFISPSDSESFGNTLLEAMNFGLPIVATDIPAYREVLGTAGILAKPTPEDFAKNIIHLIENETYRLEIVSQERERIKEFDIDNTNLKIMNLYRSLQQNI